MLNCLRELLRKGYLHLVILNKRSAVPACRQAGQADLQLRMTTVLYYRLLFLHPRGVEFFTFVIPDLDRESYKIGKTKRFPVKLGMTGVCGLE